MPQHNSPARAYGIQFQDADHESRCNSILRCRIFNTRFLDPQTMMRLGLYEDIEWMFGNLGWNSFFSLLHPTFIPLTLEFFGSLEVNMSNHTDKDEGKISFRLGGMEHALTLKQINQIFGFTEDGTRLLPRDFNANQFWGQISSDHSYDTKTAPASSLSNPMNKVAKANRGAILMGGLATQIALVLGVDPMTMERARGNPRIDLESCLAMKFLVKEGDSYLLVFHNIDKTMQLPCQSRTTVQNHENW